MIGLAGKLPAHGDFVRRGGPATLLLALDRWLDAELTRAGAIDAAIDRLDGWRFAVVAGGFPTLGAIVASGDAVGRRFPLITTLTLAEGEDVDIAAARNWTDAAAAAATVAHDEVMKADDLARTLAAITRPVGGAGQAAAGWWRQGGGPAILTDAGLPIGADFALLIEENGR